MMMEQQIVLKSDDLQDKWKTCMLHTCYAYHMAERVKEAIDVLAEVVRQIINNIREIFKPFVEQLHLVFDELKEFIDDSNLYEEEKSYPQSYPHYVDKLKVNTKGFPRPITHCARSRC